jgi:hypothetical protein
MGIAEEGVKAVGTVATGAVETFRNMPLVLAMIITNLALMGLFYYYMNRITTRTETTATELFKSQDKLFSQWASMIKDTNDLTEKAMHCILPDDALKLLQSPPRPYGSESAPARPAPPAPLQQNDNQRLRSPVFKEITVPFFEPMKFPTEVIK